MQKQSNYSQLLSTEEDFIEANTNDCEIFPKNSNFVTVPQVENFKNFNENFENKLLLHQSTISQSIHYRIRILLLIHWTASISYHFSKKSG
jgi:hypothetical protein